MGAKLSGEQAYVFHTFGVYAEQYDYAQVDVKLADTISAYWINFAKTGDPNGPGLPVWPAFDDQGSNSMLHIGSKTEAGAVPGKVGINFWAAYWNAMPSLAQK